MNAVIYGFSLADLNYIEELRRLTKIILLLCLTCSSALAQFTTEGTDFWFGFMENDLSPQRPIFLEVYVSAKENATIRLANVTGSFIVNQVVPSNSTIRIDVPINFMHDTEGLTNLGLNLTSDVDVSVYALNKGAFTADAAVILPTKVLGKEYYVMAHRELGSDAAPSARGSTALIVATEDNTEIAVTPSVQTDTGWPAGETRNITLNRGQAYQLKSESLDLTGTYIEVVDNGNSECANIAVYGGNRFTNVGGCGGNRDHLFEQMFPVSTWGKEFLWVTYETRSGGDHFKVTASEDNTEVAISGLTTIRLDAGETETVKGLTGPRRITASKPVQVAQLSRSTECDLNPNSDPFMIMLSPLEQRITQTTFDAFQVVEIDQYYINLITLEGQFTDVELDGVNIASEFTTSAGASFAKVQISQGTHTLVAPQGVIAYVYGYGRSESFGYSAGVSLENLSLRIIGEDPYILDNIISSVGCKNAPIAFTAQFDLEPGQVALYNTFDWNFGDGSTGTGQDTVHVYTEPGEYEITLVASDGNNTCGGNSEVITGTVTIVDVVVDEMGIEGAPSVCPDVSGVQYSISGDPGNTYEWTVSGGAIAGDAAGDQILVDWGAANNDAFVRVVPKNALGCPGDTLTLPVLINKRLEPLLPRGNAEVCFTDLGNVVYNTPATNGSDYEWFIEGGTILSGTNTNEITVAWDGVGSGRVWYREFNPNISDCEGFSPNLDVIIYGPIASVPTIRDVLCNGGNSGEISLALSGSKPGNYTVNWDNGMVGTDISGLVAGTYEATIQDALGCVLVETYTVGEPTLLEVSNSAIQDVRCFEESNGIITVDVTGGTPDGGGEYSYRWTGNGVDRTTREGMITGLPTGNYNVVVTDANGCTTTTDFFVDQPPLLEPDLATLINETICPDASDGTAYIEAKGGTPDYQFFWSNNPGTDQQQGENFAQGTYTLRIVDANGCETSLDIEVTERFPKIFLPTAFSPNGDGHNDVFQAVADCDLNFSMQVYNEWGSITYATTDIRSGWDGTVDGEPAPNGKYSYIVFYSGSLNGVSFEETQRGTLRLLR